MFYLYYHMWARVWLTLFTSDNIVVCYNTLWNLLLCRRYF